MEVVRIRVTERVPRSTLNEVGETAALAAYLNGSFSRTIRSPNLAIQRTRP